MKRVVATLAIVAGVLAPAHAFGADNLRYCGTTAKGLTVAVGKSPPKYKTTPCSFGWATVRKLRKNQGILDWNFRVRVNGQWLNGSIAPFATLSVITLKNRHIYVQLSAPA